MNAPSLPPIPAPASIGHEIPVHLGWPTNLGLSGCHWSNTGLFGLGTLSVVNGQLLVRGKLIRFSWPSLDALALNFLWRSKGEKLFNLIEDSAISVNALTVTLSVEEAGTEKPRDICLRFTDEQLLKTFVAILSFANPFEEMV